MFGMVDRELLEKLAGRATKIKSATRSHVKGVTVGLTPDNRVLAFRSKNYDGRGTLTGDAVDITKIAGKGGFYLASMTYDSDRLKELGWTRAQQAKVMRALKKV